MTPFINFFCPQSLEMVLPPRAYKNGSHLLEVTARWNSSCVTQMLVKIFFKKCFSFKIITIIINWNKGLEILILPLIRIKEGSLSDIISPV